MKASTKTAKALRRNSTEAEKRFWHMVRDRQQSYKFYRQAPLKNYIVDFLCPELKLVVEIDGGQHNENIADEERTKALGLAGYKVVRFWNNDVLGNSDGVMIKMKEEMEIRLKEMERPWI